MRTIQAIVLAGGYGTRLKPLTEDKPKPMLEILGKSVISGVIESALRSGVDSVCVTSMYKPELIEGHIRREFGGRIEVKRESKPYGTAGAVKNAYDGKSDAVLVLSGDGVFDFDLSRVIREHFEKGADVTIAAARNENPLEYGVLMTNENGKIESFCEKPSWDKVISSLVNTGIYVINREILREIPDGVAFDFSKQLFPLLMQKGAALYASCQSGYWCDIGNLDEYFGCICDCLEGKIKGFSSDSLKKNELMEIGVDFEEPAYVSKRVKIGKNVKITAYSSVSDGAALEDGCVISQSAIGKNVHVGRGSGIYGCIIADNVRVGENCVIPEGCVIGGGCIIGDGTILKKYTRVHAGAELKENNNMLISFKNRQGSLFCDKGVFCGNGGIGPEYFTRLGYSLGRIMLEEREADFECARLGVMTDFAISSSLIAASVINGAQSAGVHCCNFGKGYESLAKFAAASYVTDVTIYVYKAKDNTVIKLFDGTALSVTSEFERKLEKTFFSDPEYVKPPNIYAVESFEGMGNLYYGELIKSVRGALTPDGLCGFSCHIDSDGIPAAISPSNLLIDAVTEYGGKISKEKANDIPSIYISPDGTNVYFECGGKSLDHNHISAVLLNRYGEKELEKLVIPYSAPRILRVIASGRGIPVCGYSVSSGICKKESVKDIRSQLWINDGLFAALKLCALMHTEKKGISALMEEIPEFELYVDEFIGEKNRASIMEKLSRLDISENAGDDREGVKLMLAEGTVTVLPGRVAGFKIISEAASMETAKELCRKIEGIISEESRG